MSCITFYISSSSIITDKQRSVVLNNFLSSCSFPHFSFSRSRCGSQSPMPFRRTLPRFSPYISPLHPRPRHIAPVRPCSAPFAPNSSNGTHVGAADGARRARARRCSGAAWHARGTHLQGRARAAWQTWRDGGSGGGPQREYNGVFGVHEEKSSHRFFFFQRSEGPELQRLTKVAVRRRAEGRKRSKKKSKKNRKNKIQDEANDGRKR